MATIPTIPTIRNRMLAAVLTCTLLPLPLSRTADAAMIGTAETTTSTAHAKLAAALARPELRAELERLGIPAVEAGRRVAALDDAAAERAAEGLDKLPAGAGVVGVAVFVLAVMIMLDVLGYTRIFPFTSKVR